MSADRPVAVPGIAAAMTRRAALKAAAALAGGALAPAMFAGCGAEDAPSATSGTAQQDQALLEDIADTLLPTTASSPGAKAAGVGATMALLLADCKAPEVQRRVAAGLQALRASCAALGGAFATLPRTERERLLREADAQAVRTGDAHWFATVRELALTSYFTSETGMTRATRYVPVPGRYEGCRSSVTSWPTAMRTPCSGDRRADHWTSITSPSLRT